MTGVLARYTGVWVLSGTPALSVPIGFVDDMPVAMQLVGRPFEEGLLLRAAAAYQSATDWHLRRPDSAGWQASRRAEVGHPRRSGSAAAATGRGRAPPRAAPRTSGSCP